MGYNTQNRKFLVKKALSSMGMKFETEGYHTLVVDGSWQIYLPKGSGQDSNVVVVDFLDQISPLNAAQIAVKFSFIMELANIKVSYEAHDDYREEERKAFKRSSANF